MTNKIKVAIGVLVVSVIAYKIKNFKVGPCSPEMEKMINK
jgi:hypothetical protein